MAGNPPIPVGLARIIAIEALLLALPRRCPTFVQRVHANLNHFPALAPPLPTSDASGRAYAPRHAAVPPFAAWLAETFPALAWMRRSDGLRPPFASDNGIGAFAIGVVPWIAAGAQGEPPRTKLAWEREHVVAGVPYTRDWLGFLNSQRPNGELEGAEWAVEPNGPLAPVSWQIGESEREFLARARLHARARLADLTRYIKGDPAHPLNQEGSGLSPSFSESAFVPELREPDLHAEWWARIYVENEPVSKIAGNRDESGVRRYADRIGRYYR